MYGVTDQHFFLFFVYQVMIVEKHISHSLLTSYWVMSDDINDNKRKRPEAKNKNT